MGLRKRAGGGWNMRAHARFTDSANYAPSPPRTAPEKASKEVHCWPGPVFSKGSRKVTVAGRDNMMEVSYLESPPTQAFGQKMPVGSKDIAVLSADIQVPADRV